MDLSSRVRELFLIAVTEEKTKRLDVLDALRCAHAIRDVLREKYEVCLVGIKKEDLVTPQSLIKKIKAFHPAGIFNLFEGFSDDSEKEAAFIRILEKTKIPFTGNNYKTTLSCLDKNKTRYLLRRAGVAVPRGACIYRLDDRRLAGLGYPLFLKPSREDASVGIDDDSLVCDAKRLKAVLPRMLKRFPRGVVVEEFIGGIEYNCAFLGNGPYELIGISQIDYKKYNRFKPFLTYKAKWDTRSPQFLAIIPELKENLDKAVKSSIIELSSRAAKVLGCRGYFRVDLREQGGKLYVLDVNPNPDINVDSGFIRQAKHKGYSFADVVMKIAADALKCREKSKKG